MKLIDFATRQRYSTIHAGTYLLSRAAWMVEYRWRAAKSINFIL